MHVCKCVCGKRAGAPQNLDVSYLVSISAASKYDMANYSTVHHCDSLPRFRFLGIILESETQ